MANPNDAIRDAILRHLHVVHQKSRSPKSAGLLTSELSKMLKAKGYKQQEVASNLNYLVQKGWVREVVEHRSFLTKAGTTQNAERRHTKSRILELIGSKLPRCISVPKLHHE